MKINNQMKEIEKEIEKLNRIAEDNITEYNCSFEKGLMYNKERYKDLKSNLRLLKQFQKEIKEIQEELKEAIDFQIRDQKILQDLTKKRILECCKENLSNLDGIKWITKNLKDVEKYDYTRFILEKLNISKIFNKFWGLKNE